MSKSRENIKQVRERVRLEVKKSYDERIKELDKKCEDYNVLLEELKNEKQKVLSLEDELRQKNEWIERLLTYCNMTEEELSSEKLSLEVKTNILKGITEMNNLFNIFGVTQK